MEGDLNIFFVLWALVFLVSLTFIAVDNQVRSKGDKGFGVISRITKEVNKRLKVINISQAAIIVLTLFSMWLSLFFRGFRPGGPRYSVPVYDFSSIRLSNMIPVIIVGVILFFLVKNEK